MLIWLRSPGRILLLPYAPRSQNASVNNEIPCALARDFGVIVVPFSGQWMTSGALVSASADFVAARRRSLSKSRKSSGVSQDKSTDA
jgi:hypothetical protein